MVDGVQGSFGAREHADLGKNIAQVDLDRVGADVELLGDLFVAETRGNQPQDTQLSLAKIVGFGGGHGAIIHQVIR